MTLTRSHEQSLWRSIGFREWKPLTLAEIRNLKAFQEDPPRDLIADIEEFSERSSWCRILSDGETIMVTSMSQIEELKIRAEAREAAEREFLKNHHAEVLELAKDILEKYKREKAKEDKAEEFETEHDPHTQWAEEAEQILDQYPDLKR